MRASPPTSCPPAPVGVLAPARDPAVADPLRAVDWSSFSIERLRRRAGDFATDVLQRRPNDEVARVTHSNGRAA